MQVHPRTREIDVGDRRQEQRHEVERPCRVMRANAGAAVWFAVTSNISRSGMLVRFAAGLSPEAAPALGEFVRILVELPAAGDRQARNLECRGRILRLGGSPEAGLTAAMEIHSMKVLIPGRGAAAEKSGAAEKVN